MTAKVDQTSTSGKFFIAVDSSYNKHQHAILLHYVEEGVPNSLSATDSEVSPLLQILLS